MIQRQLVTEKAEFFHSLGGIRFAEHAAVESEVPGILFLPNNERYTKYVMQTCLCVLYRRCTPPALFVTKIYCSLSYKLPEQPPSVEKWRALLQLSSMFEPNAYV